MRSAVMRKVSAYFVVAGLLFVSVCIAIVLGMSTAEGDAEQVNLGPAVQFPPGSVTALELPAAFNDPMYRLDGQHPPVPIGRVAPIPIFLVHDRANGFFALYNRDTHSGCRLSWFEALQVFADPCHGARYTRTGEYRGGPAPRGLDRFAVELTAAGDVIVDISAYQQGPPGPAGMLAEACCRRQQYSHPVHQPTTAPPISATTLHSSSCPRIRSLPILAQTCQKEGSRGDQTRNCSSWGKPMKASNRA